MGGTQSSYAGLPVQQEDNGAGVGLLLRRDRRITTWDPEEGRRLARVPSDEDSESIYSDDEVESKTSKESKELKKSGTDERLTTQSNCIDPEKYVMSIKLATIILVCGFPCADVVTDYTQALPALYKEKDKTSFYMQLMVLIFAGGVGAVTYAKDHGTIPQMPPQPGFKVAYLIVITLVFPFFPYEIVVTAAWAWLTGNLPLLQECVSGAQSAAASELMEAVLSFGLQSHAYFNNGVHGVLPSLFCGLACLVKCALEQNTSKKVYWAFKMKGKDTQTAEKKFPVLTGPLQGYPGLLSNKLRFLVLWAHYVFEISSGAGCIVLFHHILHDPFVVPGLHGSLAWMFFMALQAGLMLPVLWLRSPLSAAQTVPAACTGQFFIQLPILDKSVSVLPTYASRFLGQAIIAVIMYTVSMPTEPKRMALLTQITIAASFGMTVTFITLRLYFAEDSPTSWQRRSIKDMKKQIEEDLRSGQRSYTWCNLTSAQAQHPTLKRFLEKCFHAQRQRIDNIRNSKAPGTIEANDGEQRGDNQLNTANEFIAFSMSLVNLDGPDGQDGNRQAFAVYMMGGALEELTGLVTCPTYLDAVSRNLEKMIIEGEEQAKSLPPAIGQLTALEALEISKCSFEWLPDELEQLKVLAKLTVSDCGELKSLPAELGLCQALTAMKVSNCPKLMKLPDKLGHLKALKKLEVSECNELKSLPPSTKELKALEEFTISKCHNLTRMPAELGELEALKKLEVLECHLLPFLPASMGKLKALMELKVSKCPQLTTLTDPEASESDEDGLQLTALEKLEVSECERLESLPADLGQLMAMKELKVSNCGALNSLPQTFGRLHTLEKLEIFGCTKLSALPEGLHALRALKDVEISRCWKLKQIPQLEQMPALESLTISDCRELESLPGVGALRKLQKLEIVYCGKLKEKSTMLKDLHTRTSEGVRLQADV